MREGRLVADSLRESGARLAERVGHGRSAGRGTFCGGLIMGWIALKMLTGDRSKYLGIIFGVSFATLLMGQQLSIFCGLMLNTTSQIQDIEGADIWVMDPN